MSAFLSNHQTINWHKLARNLHRDIGYFCIGLTIVFAVSGLALNHLRDWNPNYIVEQVNKPITLDRNFTDEQLNNLLVQKFGIPEPIKATYWQSVDNYKLFFDDGGSITADFHRNMALYERITERPVIKQFNRLHLNEAKQGWIVFSDIYAVLLLFLAISSLLMVKGKYSPWRLKRGWLVIAGGLIPAVYIFVL